ncbi:MAG: hypothetical protein ACXITV_05500 [Luteibaculaceae bacterium]
MHLLKTLTILAFLFLLGSFTKLKAQDGNFLFTEKKLHYFVEAPLQLSHFGFGTSLNVVLGYGRHQVYAGINSTLSSSFVPDRVQLGADFGYRYFYLQTEKLSSFAFADFFQTSYELRNNLSNEVGRNTVWEFYTGLGMAWHPTEKFSVMPAFGLGGFVEAVEDAFQGERMNTVGLSSFFSLGFQYKLSRN